MEHPVVGLFAYFLDNPLVLGVSVVFALVSYLMRGRFTPGFFVPVGVVLVVAVIIIGIGELLLTLAPVRPELGGVKEPISIIAAILIAAAILGGSAYLSSHTAGTRDNSS